MRCGSERAIEPTICNGGSMVFESKVLGLFMRRHLR